MKRQIHITLFAALTILALAGCDQIVGNGGAVTVTPPSGLAVTQLTTTSPAIAGEPLNVNATVQNTGNQAAFESVKLFVDGSEVDRKSVTLNPGVVQELSFVWSTTQSDVGSHTVKALASTEGVFVEEPADFTATIVSTNSPVTSGNTLEVEAAIENVGSTTQSQTVKLFAGDLEKDSQEVALDGGETRTITLTWDTTSGDIGSYRMEVLDATVSVYISAL